jgi:DNA modification methylase
MSRTRIIVETSDVTKSAVFEAASLQGSSVGEWFEEQLTAVMPGTNTRMSPLQSESSGTIDLENAEAALASLSAQDWSFTDDNTRYLTHDLHPYPAKFIPQIPAHLIDRLSNPGDVVLDPFGGSATTAVEAVRLGRRAISLDANPLSALIGRVKAGYMKPPVRADLEQLCAAVESRLIGDESEIEARSDELVNQYRQYLPEIPNIEKWFKSGAQGALCLIRHLIETTTKDLSRDAALLALSRIILRVSNQESETRYVSVEKIVTAKICLKAYLESLRTVMRRLDTAAAELQYADGSFLVGDSREAISEQVGENCVDLIVTSPPYPNATDYHLYHRFRLFWLGFDPRLLGKIEIGSHLRHQRNNSGFDEYRNDMFQVLKGCAKALLPGRYAVFVVGDALFKGESFSTSDAICAAALEAGFEKIGVVDRPIHTTKRSFAQPARRARLEQLVILRKPNVAVCVRLSPPAYRMWQYETDLRAREISTLIGCKVDKAEAINELSFQLCNPSLSNLRRLTFTKDIAIGGTGQSPQPTWQKILENGDADSSKRKDPKYATHGLHPYKGKFYPQLAKSLLNISGVSVGDSVLDPYCGSGTTLVEGMLNSYRTYGCDFNPLAAKIARAKTEILTLPRHVVDHAVRSVLVRIEGHGGRFPEALEHFPRETHKELIDWFPLPVLFKLNWLLSQVRLLGNRTIVDYLEVIVSSIIRDVSQQEPSDLRIRRRKEALTDAPVLELTSDRLRQAYSRLQRYWEVAGRQPGKLIKPLVVQGDSRDESTFRSLGLGPASVDAVVTSPPYATALPYIDTDRLSLLAIMGVSSSVRSGLEEALTGSREIRKTARLEVEETIFSESAFDELPREVVHDVRHIFMENSKVEVGFRKANMPALLWRYFVDMRQNMERVRSVMKSGAKAFYVVGDSRTNAGGNWVQINTCKSIALIGEQVGLSHKEMIDIDVTTENYKHIRNAITTNQVIVFDRV